MIDLIEVRHLADRKGAAEASVCEETIVTVHHHPHPCLHSISFFLLSRRGSVICPRKRMK